MVPEKPRFQHTPLLRQGKVRGLELRITHACEANIEVLVEISAELKPVRELERPQPPGKCAVQRHTAGWREVAIH